MTPASFFAGGAAVDVVLAMVAIEAALLAVLARPGRPLHFLRGLGWSLASGACLALALRIALSGGGWGMIALCLSGSLAAHVGDLTARWRAAADPAH